MAPGIGEFFYRPFWFEGTPFAVNRLVLMMFFVVGVLCLFFGLGVRRMKVVPHGMQNVVEMGIDFVDRQISLEVIGKAGQRFTPYLTTLFFFILFANWTSVLPGFHLPTTSVIALPLILAVITWVLFNVQGIKANGVGGYLKTALFPPGLPWLLYILVTPIEFFSTFILRPATLCIRLLANMLAGHLILALFFASTTYLLYGYRDSKAFTALFGVGAFVAGVIFVFFEVLVGLLQAYIFTLLTAVYLAGALEHEH